MKKSPKAADTELHLQNAQNHTPILYNFAYHYMQHANTPRDYGTGDLVTTVEAHILLLIHDHEGITVTELAKIWGRTPGAISQMVSKLIKKGLAEKGKEDGNAKAVHLYPTERGKALCAAHIEYDKGLKKKRQNQVFFTEKEWDAFYKILFYMGDQYQKGID